MNLMPLPGLAFALVLFFSGMVLMLAAARAKERARGYVRLAAVLYIALALANATLQASVAGAIAMIASALAPPALALAMLSVLARPAPPWLAGLVLLCGCVCGLAADVANSPLLALAPLVLSAAALFWTGLGSARRSRLTAIYLCMSALSLLAGAGAFLNGNAGGHMLFAAVTLLGIAFALLRSDARIENAGRRRAAPAAVSRKR